MTRKHGARWAADVQPLVDAWLFERGFVEDVKLDAARFLTVAPELYRRAPVLHLDLTGVKPVAAELFQSPHLARIQSLGLLHNGLGDVDVAALAASPHLANLRWLDLSNNQIGAAGLEALAASRNLPRLGYLGFSTNAIPDPTPRHADEYDATSPVGEELQRRYGPRPWLDARPGGVGRLRATRSTDGGSGRHHVTRSSDGAGAPGFRPRTAAASAALHPHPHIFVATGYEASEPPAAPALLRCSPCPTSPR